MAKQDRLPCQQSLLTCQAVFLPVYFRSPRFFLPPFVLTILLTRQVNKFDAGLSALIRDQWEEGKSQQARPVLN